MKKVFKFTDSKKHEDRILEAIKHTIRKYIKREKKKTLSNKATMYWDFDCKIGVSLEDAKTVKYEELTKTLETIKATGATETYIEIIAKEVEKPIKAENTLSEN